MNEELKDIIQIAWDKFFGAGWGIGETPSKRECFDAGYNQAFIDIQNELVIYKEYKETKAKNE